MAKGGSKFSLAPEYLLVEQADSISSCREACLQSLIFFFNESESEVAQLCPTLCDPMDCSLPGSSIHRIFQARILEWIAISFSRRASQPRD